MFNGFKLPKRKQKLFSSISEFNLLQKIGSGAFSVVHKAIHLSTKAIYAIKIIDFSQISFYDQENVQKEIEAHRLFKHKNIVNLHDFFQEDDRVYLVMDHCSKGNLFAYIQDKKELSSKEILKFFKQTVDAVAYMHKKGFINRDLKPENILLDKYGNIKLCDFGWTSHIEEEAYRCLRAGTVSYMSPESLQAFPQGFESDVWSLGVLLYEFYHKFEPFAESSCSKQLELITQNEIPFFDEIKKVDIAAKELILNLLVFDKEKRLTIEDIYKTRFLKDYVSKQSGSRGKRPSVSVNKYEHTLKNDRSVSPISIAKRKKSTVIKKTVKKRIKNTILPINKSSNKALYLKKTPVKKKQESKEELIDIVELMNDHLEKKSDSSFFKAKKKSVVKKTTPQFNTSLPIKKTNTKASQITRKHKDKSVIKKKRTLSVIPLKSNNDNKKLIKTNKKTTKGIGNGVSSLSNTVRSKSALKKGHTYKKSTTSKKPNQIGKEKKHRPIGLRS